VHTADRSDADNMINTSCDKLFVRMRRVLEVTALSHMNYPIRYELTTESGGQSNEFAIDSNTGVVDLLRTLDYETDPVQYHLRVKAIENRRQPVTSTVNVCSVRLTSGPT